MKKNNHPDENDGLQNEEKHWSDRLQSSLFMDKIVPLLQGVMLVLLTLLLQPDIGVNLGLALLATAVVLVVFYILVAKRVFRLHTLYVQALYFLVIGGVILFLALRPFQGELKRIYVTSTSENYPVYDLRRYCTETVDLPDGERLIVANHVAHWLVAGLLHEMKDTDRPQRWWTGIVQTVGGFSQRLVPASVTFLNEDARRDGQVYAVPLTSRNMETWTDLSGSPSKSFLFQLSAPRTAAFSLNATVVNEREDGAKRMGTDFKVTLTSRDGGEMVLSLVAPAEVVQWEDVILYAGMDESTAEYVALLTQLLNSDNLRQKWALIQSDLWATVPNDRERLRLLLLRARLDSVIADGNILSAQLLPDVIRIESLLAPSSTSAEAMVADQLLYWAAKEFIEYAGKFPQRFTVSTELLSTNVKAAAPAMEPVFLPEQTVLIEEVSDLVLRVLPPKFRGHPGLLQFLSTFRRSTFDIAGRPSPVNPKLAWMKRSDWTRLCASLPKLKLQQNTAGSTVGETAAAPFAQSPSLADAWKEVEDEFGVELTRRVLLHAESSMMDALNSGDLDAIEPAAASLVEALLQQDSLLEELVQLRTTMMGDGPEYLASRPELVFLRKTSQEYARLSSTPAPALASAPVQFKHLEQFSSVLQTIIHSAGLRSMLGEEDAGALGGELKSLAGTIQQSPRWQRIAQALVSTVDFEALGRYGPAAGQYLTWWSQVSSDPALPKIMESFEKDEFPVPSLVESLQKHVETVPLDTAHKPLLKAFLAKAGELAVEIHAAANAEDTPNDPRFKTKVRLLADMVLLARDFFRQSAGIASLADLIDMDIYAAQFSMAESVLPGTAGDARTLKELRAELQRREKNNRQIAEMSPSEQRLWRFVARMSEYAKLPDEQRPHSIVRDEKTGLTTFDPPCPLLADWVREVCTADTNGPEGSAYPYVSESLLLDMILRTLKDTTPTGYTNTEFGLPQQIFRAVTRQSVEDYLMDCVRAAEKQHAAAASAQASLMK